MDREMAAQIADGSFKLVERPAKQRRYAAFRLALHCRVYRYTYHNEGQITGGKTHLVILCNCQVYVIGENNCAPVVNFISLRAALAWAARNGFDIEHIDRFFKNRDALPDMNVEAESIWTRICIFFILSCSLKFKIEWELIPDLQD